MKSITEMFKRLDNRKIPKEKLPMAARNRRKNKWKNACAYGGLTP
jgi:hypothetical protein